MKVSILNCIVQVETTDWDFRMCDFYTFIFILLDGVKGTSKIKV
jgi:hypothetical protein